jgi:hypothetical protein
MCRILTEPERKGSLKNYIHLNIKMSYGIGFYLKNNDLKCTYEVKTELHLQAGIFITGLWKFERK